MRPPALDVASVLESAFTARDEDPELFGEWVRDVYTAKAGWHDQPDGEHWVHHASSLGECVRKHVIARSGSPREELTVQSRVTFQVGDIVHVLIQFGLAVHPDYTLLGHEIGGVAERDGLTLAAHSDAVYLDPSGQCCVIDVKSEREYAKGWREKDATVRGDTCTAKPEHVLQLCGTAGIIHRLTEYRPMHGWIIYFSKESGRIDSVPVHLSVDHAVAEIRRREDAWTDYRWTGELPPVLADFTAVNKDRKSDIGKGLCTPRSAADRRGVWCGHREECERRWKESQKLHVIKGTAA